MAGKISELTAQAAANVSPTDLIEVLDVSDTAMAPTGTNKSMMLSQLSIGTTVDTDEAYRVIMFSDGTIRAIPVGAVAPAAPTGLSRVVRISSVQLTWTASAGAASYLVYRDGGHLATVSGTNYRDGTVTVGETYAYNVVASSGYGLRSPHTSNVTAFIDPALNSVPVVEVRTFPASAIALGNRAIVRVNAIDVDGQALAYALGTSVGSLVATADPTVWYLDPV